MNPPTTTSRFRSDRPQATVIPFSRTGIRRFRREDASLGEPLGRILLFTGVRYERMPDTGLEAPLPQRKRS